VRRHVGTDAAHLFGGFLATLSTWCEQHGILVVAEDDQRLTWPEREFVRELGDRLYGKRQSAEARHG
jgi:hypothetical protein